MSRNVDVVAAAAAAWNRQDLDAWLATLHPDVEFRTSGVFPDNESVYRGHKQLAEFWQTMHHPWETLRLDLEHTEEHGDWVVYKFRFRAQGVDSGVKVDLEFANAVRVERGLAIEIVARRTLSEARAEVSARESAPTGTVDT